MPADNVLLIHFMLALPATSSCATSTSPTCSQPWGFNSTSYMAAYRFDLLAGKAVARMPNRIVDSLGIQAKTLCRFHTQKWAWKAYAPLEISENLRRLTVWGYGVLGVWSCSPENHFTEWVLSLQTRERTHRHRCVRSIQQNWSLQWFCIRRGYSSGNAIKRWNLFVGNNSFI